MKKSLLTATLIAIGTFYSMAVPQVYSTDLLGELNGVSPNGKYAAAADFDNHRAYLWVADNPEEWLDITPTPDESLPVAMRQNGAELYAVSDDGLAVGCVFYGDHSAHPAIWKDGVWEDLPMHPASMNSNAAIAVTSDAGVIGGYMFIKDPANDIPGHYYPCRWVRDEEGEYNLTAYTDIELPDHQGFFPSTMSPDGEIIAGLVYCGVNSTVPSLIDADGNLTIFAKFETKYEPFIYRGKYETRDEDGKQGWTDDPNDPNIVLYPTSFIDGFKDSSSEAFEGRFSRFDWSGHIYGAKTIVSDLNEEGEGTLTTMASIYNVQTEEWTLNPKYNGYSTGLDELYMFAGATKMVADGVDTTLGAEFGVSIPRMLAAVNATSADGQILGCMTMEVNPATGEYDLFPLIIKLNDPLVEPPHVDPPHGATDVIIADSDIMIILSPGRIDVKGADSATVYTLDGKVVAQGASLSVASGIYVVKAGSESFKVVVK